MNRIAGARRRANAGSLARAGESVTLPGAVRTLLSAGIGLPPFLLVVLAATGAGGGGSPRTKEGSTGVAMRDSLERLYWMPGPTSGDVGNGMVFDDGGTLFIVGFHGGLDFENDGKVDLPADGIDPFLLKFSAQGALSWVRSPTAPGCQSSDRIALDRAGAVEPCFGMSRATRPGTCM